MPLVLTLLVLISKAIKYVFYISLAVIFFGFLADNKNLKIGDITPNFSAKLFNNKDFNFNNLKGSYTLIQFWASWNLPSLKTNIELVKTYNKYKDTKFVNGKKFNVVSISIDQKPETYKVTIARENLPWQYLICDYNGWKSPLIDTFNIEHIPANFLVNPNGIIIAKNIFDNELENELFKYLKK